MFTSVLSGKVLFVFPIFVSFSIMVVSLPSITSANSVAVSVLFGNWGVCASPQELSNEGYE